MIQDILDEAMKDINLYYDSRQVLQNNQNFSDNLVKLAAQTNTLKKALELFTYLETQNLTKTPLLDAEEKASLLGLLNECGEKVVGHYLDASTISLLERDTKRIYDSQKINWKNTTYAYARNVVDSLNIMSSLLEEPSAAHALKEDIINFQDRWPVTEQDVLNFKASVVKGRELLATLPIDNDVIAEFVKKLQQQQATVDDLSNEVLEWIRNKNLEGRIKLSITT